MGNHERPQEEHMQQTKANKVGVEAAARVLYEERHGGLGWDRTSTETRQRYMSLAEQVMHAGIIASLDDAIGGGPDLTVHSRGKTVFFDLAGRVWWAGNKLHDIGVWFARRANG